MVLFDFAAANAANRFCSEENLAFTALCYSVALTQSAGFPRPSAAVVLVVVRDGIFFVLFERFSFQTAHTVWSAPRLMF